jgi:signal transduction histidine kinase
MSVAGIRRAGTIRVRMTLAAGVIAALVSLGISALVIIGIRGQVEDYEERTTTALALHVLHLIKRERLPRWLPADDRALAVQVLDARGNVVSSTWNLRGQPRVATFRPGEDSAFAVRELDRVPGLDGPMQVVVFRVYEPSGDWTIYAVDRAVPWYGNATLCAFLLALSALMTLLFAVRTWWTVDRTLAPVDAIRAELEEITATESGRRVPVPESRDEIRLLAETANQTLDRLDDALIRQRRFTSDASHDLRNPIAAARTRLEEALMYPRDADWPQVGSAVLASLDRLQAIVTDLLELARLDAETRRPAAEAGRAMAVLDLADVVAAELERRLLPDGRVETRLQPGVFVRGDRLRLSRLLANLLDNAVRHAADRVTVSVYADGGTAIMEVLDDGEGIAPAERELVFQRFVRLKASKDRDAEGTGLGLPIAREIATAHHGTLRIEDSERGARFVLRLPRIVPEVTPDEAPR